MSCLIASKFFTTSQWTKQEPTSLSLKAGRWLEGQTMSERKIMLINTSFFLSYHISLYSTSLYYYYYYYYYYFDIRFFKL